MRTISGSLISAQQSTKRKPYVNLVINSINYSDRVLIDEHHVEQYRDYATIVLNNADRGLDNVDLKGYRFRVGYGYYTGQIVAPPNGDNTGNEYSENADLWVKAQQFVSSPGQLVCVLYCEGQWSYLREQRVMAYLGEIAVGDPNQVGNDPYFSGIFDATKSVYQLIESVIEQAFGWTLEATPSPDDNILNGFHPMYSLVSLPYAAVVLMELIEMTKCFIRPRANLTWEIVYPQTTDTTQETYYSDQAPHFTEYADAPIMPVPNRTVIFAGNPEGLDDWPVPVIVGDSGAYSGNYVEVMDFELAPTITTQADAAARAAALQNRNDNAAQLAGYLIAPLNCRLELYDRIQVRDRRGR